MYHFQPITNQQLIFICFTIINLLFAALSAVQRIYITQALMCRYYRAAPLEQKQQAQKVECSREEGGKLH